jgi:hypothetical protein
MMDSSRALEAAKTFATRTDGRNPIVHHRQPKQKTQPVMPFTTEAKTPPF